MKKLHPGILPSLIIVIVFTGIALVANYFRLNAEYPLWHTLANQHLLDGATKIYQMPTATYYSQGIGDDSYLRAIYRLSAPIDVTSSNPLRICQKSERGCSTDPAWQPRSAFLTNNLPSFSLDGLPPSATAAYKAVANDTRTRCTAHNLTFGQDAYFTKHPDQDVLCVNNNLHLLTYEYLSRDDSKPFK